MFCAACATLLFAHAQAATSANTIASAFYLVMETSREQQLQQLHQPLQLFVLPLLPARALAGLRGTCTLLQGLVDDDISSLWHQAASCLVPRKCLHGAHDAFAVQQVLRGQGQLSSVLTSGLHRKQDQLHWSLQVDELP